MDLSNTVSKEEIKITEFVRNLAIQEENIHFTLDSKIAQSSTAMAEELHHVGSANSRAVNLSDESTVTAENAIGEREKLSEDLEREREESISEESESEELEDDDEVFVPLTSAKADEYCILCRARLFPFYFINEPDVPRYHEWLSENPAEQWQLETRAVMSLRVDDVEKPVMTDVVVFKSLQVEASLVGRPESGEIVLHSRPGLDHMDTYAHCFHDWCYSIFSWRTKHKSAEFLYKLATSLKISPAWENPAESNDPLYPQINFAPLLSTVEDISARLQPQFLSKLPSEVRYRIWNYVGSKTAYSAFMLVAGETTRLAQQISQQSVQDLLIEPDCYIEAGSIDIYGTGYIRDLTKKKETGNGIKILRTVTEIEVVSSVHGICSIRFFGSGWTSEWLGTTPQIGHIWYGTIQLTSDRLLCFHNGLCIANLTDAYKTSRLQVMWDRPHHPPATFDANSALFSFFDPQELYPKLLPELRFFRFVSLIDHGEYISGLTMYFLDENIVGVESHFSTTSHFVGSHGEVAVHVSLAPGEIIEDVWLRLFSNVPLQPPSVLIQTTFGREYTFGPDIPPDNHRRYRWVMLKHTGCVNGFYYENAPKIRRIGITGDNKEMPKAQIRLPRYYPSMPVPTLGNPQFVNDAKICAMETVNVCRVGTRCVGIFIKYSDPKVPPAVLGQWYGSKESDHTCIYDYNKVTSTVIAFKISESESAVRDILICNHDAPELEELTLDIKVQVYKIGTRLVWWFNTINDSISLWEDGHGTPSSIPTKLALVQNFD